MNNLCIDSVNCKAGINIDFVWWYEIDGGKYVHNFCSMESLLKKIIRFMKLVQCHLNSILCVIVEEK